MAHIWYINTFLFLGCPCVVLNMHMCEGLLLRDYTMRIFYIITFSYIIYKGRRACIMIRRYTMPYYAISFANHLSIFYTCNSALPLVLLAETEKTMAMPAPTVASTREQRPMYLLCPVSMNDPYMVAGFLSPFAP